jgi:hypothetical protein
MITYYKKSFFLESVWNSLEQLILQGYLISRIRQAEKKSPISDNSRQLALKLLLRILGGSMMPDNSISKAKMKVLYKDICSTCNYGELCVSKKTRQGPVWFCEEFEDHVTVEEENGVDTEFQIIPPWKEPGSNEGSIRFKGLCINCENRVTCANSKKEGGVWHCEEYC